jgi:hypothetical protein
MDKRIITYVTDAEGKKHPAEVRGCVPEKDMVAIYRDYNTTKLLAETFSWQDGQWVSKSGMTSDYAGGAVATPAEELIRVSKK